jgi:MFS family permease
MLDISKYSSLKYFLFGSLYFAEGIHLALSTVLIVIYFNEKDISIATTTLVVGIAYLPWVVKFILGTLTDFLAKLGRKFFIILGGILGAGFLFPLAIIDPKTSLVPFTILLFLSHTFVVFLDVSSDAWAIQVAKSHERGKVNASMTAGMFSGMAFSTLVLSYIANTYTFSTMFIAVGIIILATIILPLVIKEKKIVKQKQSILSLVISEFKKKNTKIVALFGFVAAMNFGMMIMIIPEYMMTVLDLDVVQTGLMTTLYPIATVFGAVTGGTLSDYWGRKKTLFIFLSGALITSALFITATTWQTLAILYPLIGFLQGSTSFAAKMALYMDNTNPAIGATQFSIFTSISNFGDIGIAMISGSLVVLLGYQRFFLYAALIIGPALLLLYFVQEKQDIKIKRKKG